jgi:hypothetical protein
MRGGRGKREVEKVGKPSRGESEVPENIFLYLFIYLFLHFIYLFFYFLKIN